MVNCQCWLSLQVGVADCSAWVSVLPVSVLPVVGFRSAVAC